MRYFFVNFLFALCCICCILILYIDRSGNEMKLFYNKNSKDPIYYAQQGIRNGKKVTTRNIKRFGKHSELLKITDDPLTYVKNEIQKMNEEYRVAKWSTRFQPITTKGWRRQTMQLLLLTA